MRDSASRSSCRLWYAAFTVLRETCNSVANSRVEGRREPGITLPLTIACFSARASCW
jgi:hypothetical protein